MCVEKPNLAQIQIILDPPSVDKFQHTASTKTKIDSIELLRILSIIGVIWFHNEGSPYKYIGHAGLISFVIICSTFQSVAAEQECFKVYLMRRCKRIAPPWLAWFVIYAIINFTLGRNQFPWSQGIIANVLTGPWIGLWFLPFVLISSPIIYILTSIVRFATVDQSIAVLLCLAGLLLTVSAWILKMSPSNQPWSQWLHASAAIPLSLAFKINTNTPKVDTHYTTNVITVIWIGLCILLLWINSEIAVTYAIGVLAFSTAITCTLPIPKFITKPGCLCLGVYLIHPIIMGVLKQISVFRNYSYMMLFGTVLISFGMVKQLRRMRTARNFI